MTAAVLALVGAVLIGSGSAKQHAVAVVADRHAPMDPRLIARTLTRDRRGVTFAILAGLSFGTADALIKAMSTTADDFGAAHLLSHWSLYTWMVVSPLAFLLQQSAYHSTHLGAAMPATSTFGPTTATILGAAMFGEQVRGGWAVPV